MMKFLRAACVGAVAFIVMLQSIPAPAQQPAVPSGTLQPEQPLLAPPVAKPTNAGRQSPAAVTVPSSLQQAPARPAIRPSVGSPPSPAEPPSAIPDPVRPAAGIGPLRELSPWSMFLSADILVKAVIVGLIFASLVTWTLFLAKTIHLSLVRRDLRSALTRIAKVRTLSEAQLALGAKSNVLLELLSAAMQEVQLSDEAAEDAGIKERSASRFSEIVRVEARSVRSGMAIIATIGATAPFVGLFGTVWGIMNSFIGISKAQTTNLAVVAPGIAEALLATAVGLGAAIPAVIIYNHFSRSTRSYLDLVGRGSGAVGRLLSRDLDRFHGRIAARAAE
jgi:biopolymer transport protein ExbB